MRKFYLASTLLFLLFASVVSAQNGGKRVELKEITNGHFRQVTNTGEMRSLPDGEHYTAMNEARNMIIKYSYRTGNPVDTLFNTQKARECTFDTFEGYTFSSTGHHIFVWRDIERLYRRSFRANVYNYDVRRNYVKPISDSKSKQMIPTFSPDGRMVAYVSDNNIWIRKFDYDTEVQVTKDGELNKVLNGITDWVYEEEFSFNCAFDFSADSELLAWIRFDETDVKTFSFPWYRGAAPSMDNYKLYPGSYEYKYPKAGEDNSKVSVLSYDIKSRVTRTMQVPMDADGYIPRIQFTSTKDRLMVLNLNRHQNRLDFYAVNPRSTQAQLVLREEEKTYVDQPAYDDGDFSRDQFVLISDRDGHRHLYLYTSGGQLVSQLTSGDYDVTAYYGASADGKTFFYASNEGSPLEQYIYKIDTSGRKTKLSTEKGFNSAIFSSNCLYYLNIHSDISTPPVYTLCTATGKQLKVIEDNAKLRGKLASLTLSKPEIISITTADGVQLNGWMVKPADFSSSKRYPVLMYQYSGPGSQQVLNSYSNGFVGGLTWEQRLAEKGYIVVCVDGRGTGGRGSDFLRCTYMRMGDLESHDQVEAALWLGRQPYVDKDRIAIWGWSFGGFNTIMSLCKGRQVFNCGVAVAPVTDWRFYDSAYTERFMRTPQENPDGYDCSPLHRYENLKGDLLLIHGTADDNVHYQNTAELAEALVQAQKQFDMQVYTNRNHSIYGGKTRLHLIRRIEDYLDRHLLR